MTHVKGIGNAGRCDKFVQVCGVMCVSNKHHNTRTCPRYKSRQSCVSMTSCPQTCNCRVLVATATTASENETQPLRERNAANKTSGRRYVVIVAHPLLRLILRPNLDTAKPNLNKRLSCLTVENWSETRLAHDFCQQK